MSFYYALHSFDGFPLILTNTAIEKLLKPFLSLGAKPRFRLNFYGFPLLSYTARELNKMIPQKDTMY